MPAIQPTFVIEQFEDTILHPAEGVLLVLVFPFEDVTFREILSSADKKPLFDKEVAWIFLSNTHKICHDIGYQAEFLNTVVPLSSNINHPEGLGVFSSIEALDHQIQPANWLSVVIPYHEVQPVVFVDYRQLT